MLDYKNYLESFSRLKKGPKPVNKNITEAGQSSGTNQKSDIEKEASPNLFEDHIRSEKKEGA